MMTKKDIFLELGGMFMLRRKNAELFSEAKKQLALKDSIYSKLDSEERQLILDLSKASFQKKTTETFNLRLDEIKQQKLIRLKELNIDPKSLTPNYSCKKCNDTGVVDHSYCTCYRQAYNNLLMKKSNIQFEDTPLLSDYNLSIFESHQHEQMQKLVTIFKQLVENFKTSKIKNFLICGATATGKTYLSKTIAKEVIRKGYLTYYLSSFEFNTIMLNYHTSPNEYKNKILEPILNSDLLIIDDLGTEPVLKNVTLEYLLLILNERVEHNKVTIITTNLGPNHILARYNERIFSRLMNKKNSLLVELKGEDLRLKKKVFNS